ncbi:MAG: hypothetical protein GIKADHBN_03144 [Phycisphaerales bacterium]|nr:hypothetical protein [Phycisphaerales bacterium]
MTRSKQAGTGRMRRHTLRGAAVFITLASLGAAAHGGGERCAEAVRSRPGQITVAASVLLGPPMICHEILIGKARSLPWDGGRGGSSSSYNIEKLPSEAAALLAAEPSAIVRMETLRRAAVYLSHDESDRAHALAWEFIGRRAGAVLSGEASGKIDPQAWFDVAYFIGCLNQVGLGKIVTLGEADGIPGYRFMLKAIEEAEKSQLNAGMLAQMHFGAAVMSHPAMRHKNYQYAIGTVNDVYDRHVLAALKSSKDDQLLETNLSAHLRNFGSSIDDVRKVAAAGK